MGFVPTHNAGCSTHTFPTQCRRCRHSVFFFHCSCGSALLFDRLGAGWPIHDCEAAETAEGLTKAAATLRGGKDVKSGTHSPFAGLDELIDVGTLKPIDTERLTEVRTRADHPVRLRPEHIIKPMDPTEDGEPVFFIGLLSEKVADTANLKRIYAGFGDLGRRTLGLPGQNRAVQLTVIDAGGEPNESYTVIADRGAVDGMASKGSLVGVSLVGRVGRGYCFWLLTEFQVL